MLCLSKHIKTSILVIVSLENHHLKTKISQLCTVSGAWYDPESPHSRTSSLRSEAVSQFEHPLEQSFVTMYTVSTTQLHTVSVDS